MGACNRAVLASDNVELLGSGLNEKVVISGAAMSNMINRRPVKRRAIINTQPLTRAAHAGVALVVSASSNEALLLQGAQLDHEESEEETGLRDHRECEDLTASLDHQDQR
ncbi:hypothetical protein HPB50_008093 [Hyalomma asiaticum]|uniref:Uncharacterized protein n=1 Tax=Hyalomma asiaticum TaxID=266040 RepID=A0ACB7SA39_HYAAI|nr:hypothetical protein HPB50_008093 [Hyalomma asiaticum]